MRNGWSTRQVLWEPVQQFLNLEIVTSNYEGIVPAFGVGRMRPTGRRERKEGPVSLSLFLPLGAVAAGQRRRRNGRGRRGGTSGRAFVRAGDAKARERASARAKQTRLAWNREREEVPFSGASSLKHPCIQYKRATLSQYCKVSLPKLQSA